MKKLFLVILTFTTTKAVAYFNYSAFQRFDDQVSLGFNSQHGDLSYQNAAQQSSFSFTAANLEVEKLFSAGVWGDINVGQVETYVEDGMPLRPLGSYPYLVTANLKVGYNIPLNEKHFAFTPYFLLGKNSNFSQAVAINNSASTPSDNVGLTQNYFYTAGFGLRLEVPMGKYVYMYFDQLLADNLDQTDTVAPNNTVIDTSNWQFTTTLGLKLNVSDVVQFGGNVFYTNYTGYNATSYNYLNSNLATGVPVNQYGAQLSVGFLFK